jgi:hypothetical protein
MKKTFIFIAFLISSFIINAQVTGNFNGTVEEISGIPVFLYSLPVQKYSDAGKASSTMDIIKVSIDEQSSVESKTEKLIKTAFKRKENGKISDFDAIVIDIDNEKVTAIKFESGKSLDAKILSVNNIAIYFFSKPKSDYEKIADLPADFSRWAKNGMLEDKVKNMVKRAMKKVEKGEIKPFDAILIDPVDFTGIAIKINH